MTDTNIEAPVPADCDLRDMRWMPLDVERLRRSKAWLMAKRQPELGFYMMNLWTSSWHEVPSASLEDDDDVLADRAMCDPERWPEVREKVLHGWVRHGGRLYHPVVAEKAAETWLHKVAFSNKMAGARDAKKAKKAVTGANAAQPQTPQQVSDSSIIEPIIEPGTGLGSAHTLTGTETERETKTKTPPPTPSSSNATTPSSSNAATTTTTDAKVVVQEFLRLRDELYPDESGFPSPEMTIEAQAVQLLELAPVKLIIEVMERTMRQDRKREGARAPYNLKCCTFAVERAAAGFRSSSAPRSRQEPVDPVAAASGEMALWRKRVDTWRKDQSRWLLNWGFPPDDRSTIVPRDILREFGLGAATIAVTCESEKPAIAYAPELAAEIDKAQKPDVVNAA